MISMILLQKISLLQSSPRVRGVAKLAAWANILLLPVGVLAWLHPTSNIPAQRDSIVGTHVPTGVTITEVSHAASADEAVDLRGLTAFAGKKHYVIVQPPLGAPVIQGEPMRVSSDGEVTGRAVLGSKAAGAGEEFTIQVFATGTALQPGSQSVPPDAQFSDPVKVKRKPKGA